MSALLDSAIAQIGKLHDGPDVVRMAQEIAAKQPEQAAYWKDATASTPWCGDFIAWNLVVVLGLTLPGMKNGVGPLWVDWWLGYGIPIPVGQERPGDLALWLGNPPPHHISIVAGNGQYVGGNQSDGVTRAHFRTPDAIRRPPIAEAVTADPQPEIKIGALGEPVKTLQRLLGVEADGDFGPLTDVAVRAFQVAHGLDVDGEVGPLTWAALLANPQHPLDPHANVLTSKGSWYSQYDGKYHWHDSGDAPGSAALGVPDDAQGIARPGHDTLGTWFMVRAPNGKVSIEIQSDLGPAAFTGRTIDISAAAAERFGYSPANFPTDSIFTFWPVDSPKEVAGLSKQLQAIKYRDIRKDIHMAEPTDSTAPKTPPADQQSQQNQGNPGANLPAFPLPQLDVLQGLNYIVSGNRDKVRSDLKLFLDVFNSKHADIPIALPPAPATDTPATTPIHKTTAFQLGAVGGVLTGILHQLGVIDPNMAILGAIVSAGTAFLGPSGAIVGTIVMNLIRAAATASVK